MKDNLRVWVLGAVLVAGALIAGGWFVGVQPLLTSASTDDAAAAQAETQNQTLQVKLLGLQAAGRNIGNLRIAAAKVQSAVPSSLDAQSFVNRLNVLAAEDGVKVGSITPGAPIAYSQPSGASGRVEAFVSPQITAANFAVIPMSVQVSGTVKQDRVFLGHVTHDARLFLADGYTEAASTDGGSTAATITGFLYALKGAGD